MLLNVRKIESAIQAAKASGKDYKHFDGRGLFLLTKGTGSALWRLRYRLKGRDTMISLGQYPDVSLKMARDRRDDERRKIADGIDPVQERRVERIAQINTFELLAKEYLKRLTDLTEGTIRRHKQRLNKYVYPFIGSKPINEISAQELLLVLRKVEATGKLDTAKRIRELCSSIWCHAIHESMAEFDIAASLKGAIKTAKQKFHPAITDPKKLGELLRAIDGYEDTSRNSVLTAGALKLAAMLFVRPGELRRMEWKQLDLDEGTWRIPKEIMKMREAHIVPLSKQAVKVIKSLEVHSGSGRYAFPSLQTEDRPMSENTINGALRRLGYSGEVHVGHGFRTTASTLLNEQGYEPDVIELQLAHKARGVRAIYNRAIRLDERRKMMQEWSDYLDKVKAVT